MRTMISEQPDSDHHLSADDDEEEISALILKDLSGITFCGKTNGCWLTLEILSYFARSSQGVQKSTLVYAYSEIHVRAIGSADG